MSYKSIVFDLDGTLLDTLTGLAMTGNEVLAGLGHATHPPAAYRHFVGDGVHNLVRRMLPAGVGDTAVAGAVALFGERYASTWRENCQPYPGIPAMLNALRQSGYLLAVLSNKPHPFTEKFVEAFFAEGIFDQVYGERPGFPRKPDPTVALMILARLGCQPHESVFVGDSAVDIRTGKAAGMTAFGVAWGFRGTGELVASGADRIVADPMELVSHVRNTP